MTLTEIAARFPQWTRKTQLSAWLADLRREVGDETMNDIVNECYNSGESDIDEEGDVWICRPQTGHWADEEELERLVEFIEKQND